MSWINSRQFTISNRNGRHYVFRRNNAGNTEINIPAHIVSKGQAIAWLKAHPNKVANPTRYKAKGKRAAPQPGGLKRFERMVNGKKMIAFVNKEGKPYFRPAPPSPPKRAVKFKAIPPPHVEYHPGRRTPPGGWRYPAPKLHPYTKLPNIIPKNAWAMTCDELKSSLDSLTPIGKGRQGIVFTATQRAGNKRPFAVKVAPRDLMAAKRHEPQPVDIEFNIQDAVQIYTPNVVRIYKNMRCENFITPTQMNMPNVQNSARYDKSKQGILLMEFASGGSLDSWLKKRAHVNDAVMAHIISDILTALFKIQFRQPDFRHNDLHMQNIFVADRGFLIGDFGWARLKKSGTNPAVNTANGTKTASFWGVGPKTDERYDHHLFLNEMLDWAMKHSPADHPKAIEFLKNAIPEGYRGETNKHVTQWRLKYGDPCSGLPSLAAILSFPFLSGKKRVASLNLRGAKMKLKPVKIKRISSVNLVKAKAKLKPVKKNTKAVTSAQLRRAKAKLKAVGRPKPKPRITGYNLRAAKARLRKVRASPPKAAKKNFTARTATRPNVGVVLQKRKRAPIPRDVLRSNKFNRLVEKIRTTQGGPANESYNNARHRARMQAINQVESRINRGLAPFSPSPPKLMNRLPPPLSPLGPPPKPKPKAKVPSPPKPKPKNSNFKLSPSSGRAKVKSNSSGRWVYANLHFSMEELKALAGKKGVNIKGLRSKANIAKKIFT
jgi:serine/threonine protein kinase